MNVRRMKEQSAKTVPSVSAGVSRDALVLWEQMSGHSVRKDVKNEGFIYKYKKFSSKGGQPRCSNMS